MNNIIDLIKQNKKVAIIGGVIIALVLVMLLLGRGGSSPSEQYLGILTSINNEAQYNGTVELTVGNKDVNLEIIKNENNFAVSATLPESGKTYPDLIVKQDGTLYLNTNSYSADGGLVAIREAGQTEGETIRMTDALINSLANATVTTSYSEEEGASISVNSTEEWNSFFGAIQTGFEENTDMISGKYKDKETIKNTSSEFARYFKTAAETTSIANTIASTLKQEEVDGVVTYTGSFEITADFSTLPEFVNPDDFDTNQLKITGKIHLTAGPASTAKPVGAVYDATSKSLSEFISLLWADMFKREAFVPQNEVTITSNSVTNKYDLGETTEVSTFTFDKEGVAEASWIITSYNLDIINAYIKKYAPNEKFSKNEITSEYVLILTAGKTALESLNKLGTTPQEFGDYLKTAKGGEIIV